MGKIFLQGESLKTEHIPEEQCDSVISDFCDMHDCATKADDKFYAEEELYGDNDAPIYRYFLDWSTFTQKEYSKGISFNSYSRLKTVFAQNPNMESVKSKILFEKLENPKAFGGFKIPNNESDLIVDVKTWREWREKWFCCHQELIRWNDWDNDFFVNKDVNEEIIKNEIRKFIADNRRIALDECTDNLINETISSEKKCHIDENLNNPLAKNALTIFFHRIVMQSHARGGNRQGYLVEIGSSICKANYYIELQKLSAMEKEAAPLGQCNTQRSIWGIKNNQNKWKFISFDFEKGLFEFHDDSGNHLGEFMFDGSKNADPVVDHALKCVMNWRKESYIK